tara:strand:+ start:8494 stop:8808 length:315 start_codon:yes stop_codon:yes gene_type:complete
MNNYPVFTKQQLKEANAWAISMNYNRALEPKPLEKHLSSLTEDTKFPIVLSIFHEHAEGQLVDPHMRCEIVIDQTGKTALIDVDMDLFNSLEIIKDSPLEEEPL